MTPRLELCAYSFWQHAALARRALLQGSLPILADCLKMIEQIRDHADNENLRRCCESTLSGIRQDALCFYGRIPLPSRQTVTRFPR